MRMVCNMTPQALFRCDKHAGLPAGIGSYQQKLMIAY
jgi:hypothetical protein